MRRRAEDRRRATSLHDLALPHHADPIGVAAYDLQIMGDQQQREAAPAFLFREQFQDLRLDRYIQRRRRFVRDQQRRIIRQCRGDHDALALSAGQLVRECSHPLDCVGETGLIQQINHPLLQRGGRHPPMQQYRLPPLGGRSGATD